MLPGRPLELPEDSDHFSDELHVLRVDRLEGIVLGLETHAAVLPEQTLQRRLLGRLVLAGEGDDDVAVPRVLSPLDDCNVAVQDPGVDHRVALDPEQELLAPARQRLRNGEDRKSTRLNSSHVKITNAV